MKSSKWIVVITLWTIIITSNSAFGQGISEKIEAASLSFATAVNTESISKVASYFNSDSRILPEYHPTLRGSRLIASYYSDFFSKVETEYYKRKPFQIEQFGPLFLEMGLYEYDYKIPGGQNISYHGKYMTYWSVTDGKPQIVANIWGSSSWFDAAALDHTYVHAPMSPAIELRTPWEKEIEQSRQFAYKAVFEGDAETQLISYDDEAIYMTYYDPPFIGKEAVSNYFLTHYNPEIPKDSLNTRIVEVIDLGDYALKFGEYYVAWTYEGQPGLIHGKGVTLFKRSSSGTIKIFRQMINHSMPPTMASDYDRYQASRICKHLDNQNLALEDYLAVYAEDAKILPPGASPIDGIEAFEEHLEKEKANGSITIQHEVTSLSSDDNLVLLEGASSGKFFANGATEGIPFATKNLMVLKRDEMDQLRISKLIWNMGK